MKSICYLNLFIAFAFLNSCAVNKNYSPQKKYPKTVLQDDFSLLRKILEAKHPSLYWYTSKDSIDSYFDEYQARISDSMTEQQFAWQILAPMVSKIRCGHTSVSLSKAYGKWVDGKKFSSFPLSFKVWNDTMAVTGSLIRKDSIFKRGTLVTSVNGIRNKELIEKVFSYLPQDGYASSNNYIRISANFQYYHRNIFGLSREYKVTYIDSTGKEQETKLALYTPPKDTVRKKDSSITKKPAAIPIPRGRRNDLYRSLEIDSNGKYAIMRINTFSRGKLRSFFKDSFRELNEKGINNLILDIRLNGGGRVSLSTLLTKYISRKSFRVADTLVARSRTLGPYSKYIKAKLLYNLGLFAISRKNKDGQYHFRRLEKKVYQPKKKNHYNGNVYVLIAGPSFSASSLFANVVKGQPGITLVGEETGGGWYGNNGIMIPDIILPHTKTTVRLPLFRLVQYNHQPQYKGLGIPPDVYVGTSYDAIIKGYDMKMRVAKKLIADANP